jgi:glycosyltransferase involved in cell wall biosynthesis
MKVAIYTIALNEEQFVERWYKSAKDADYLMIADTGSTDGTIEKAKALGINVESIKIMPWRFDDARNAALALLPADIDMCISLDMDEVITPNWREPLEEAFNRGINRPTYKHIWSWNPDGTPGLEFAYDHIHSRKNFRWKHPVHECLYVYGAEERKAFLTGIETHHHPDSTKSRSQYLPLLKMSVEEDPYNDRNSYYYGRELFFYRHYEEAINELKRHLSLPTAYWKPERAASMRYIAKSYGDFDNKLEWFKKAIDECPDRREAYVEIAEVYYSKEMWRECLEACENALKIQEKPLEYLCEEFAWGYAPYDYACIASYQLGEFEKALGYAQKALEFSPDDERLKKNVEVSFNALNQ